MTSNEYNIGDIVCLVKDREGVIKFHGQIIGKEGTYYGVEVTFGEGKHSGTYKGTKYFSCKKKQGIFVEDRHIVSKIGDEFDELLEEDYETYRPPTPKKKKAKRKNSKKTSVPTYNEKGAPSHKVMATAAAQELMALSKTELIKRCKERGIVCLGSKKVIVNALLTVISGNRDRPALANLSLLDEVKEPRTKHLILAHCNSFFMKGFIKSIDYEGFEHKSTKQYIKSLKLIILEYIGRGGVMPAFDVCPRTYRSCIKNDGSLITRAKVRTSKQCVFGCRKGFKPNTGIHRFSIRINKIMKRKNKKEPEKDEFGVLSNLDICKMNSKEDMALWNVDCNTYYITLAETYGTHKVQSGAFNKDKVKIMTNDSTAIKRKDIITCELDTDRGRMHFEKNNVRYCETFKVIRGCTYYPAVSSCTKLNEYEAVFF
eukprot:235745_1